MPDPYPPLRPGHPCPACGAEPVGDHRSAPPAAARHEHAPIHKPDCQHPQVLAVTNPPEQP